MDSDTLAAQFLTLHTIFSNHSIIVNNNIMIMVIAILDAARGLKTSTAIAAALKVINDEYHLPSPVNDSTTYAINQSTTIEVTNLKAGKRIMHQVIDNNSRHAYKNEETIEI